MTKQISRRRFLKYAGVGSVGALLGLAGCAAPPQRPPRPHPLHLAATEAPCPPSRLRRLRPLLRPRPKILRIRLYGDMDNIDPAFRISNNDETIMDCVFSKLVTYGPGRYDLKNDLAEKIESPRTGRPSRSRSVKGSSGRKATASSRRRMSSSPTSVLRTQP